MKRIEDAPKELQDMFAVVWEQVVCSASGISDYRDEIEHVFLKGFDTVMATNGLPQRPKRTISNIIKLEGSFFAISSDGKMFSLERNIEGERVWVPYPDLPQEEVEK